MLRFVPDRSEFKRLAQPGKTVPVYCQLLSEGLTPVTAFDKIARHSRDAFLLESVSGGENVARYSFVAADPVATFSAVRERVTVCRDAETHTFDSADPLTALAELLEPYDPVRVPGLPSSVGGLVGYAGYDMVRYYERLPDPPHDDRHLPDLFFGLYETVVLFDHVNKTVKVIANARIDGDDLDEHYRTAYTRIQAVVEALAQPQLNPVGQIHLEDAPIGEFDANIEREEFENAVLACKEYIRAGDIFQVVLSQRLSVHTAADPFDIYRALRVVNPSPFMFYLKTPDCLLIGASPEIMCKVVDGVVTNRPLAGTRPRGRNEEEDKALEADLLADPKERAEHVMLVDLGRNDVGRIAQPGSVRLGEVMTVERYSHVMHISSNVTGTLAAGRTAFDALRATLPVGTVSGAPKVRAMEIIDEFEPTRRGPYAGAVGSIDFSGDMNTCIALRTMVVLGDRVDVQVGAGIVADSVPENEYAETLNKARAMFKAIRVAEQGFGL